MAHSSQLLKNWLFALICGFVKKTKSNFAEYILSVYPMFRIELRDTLYKFDT